MIPVACALLASDIRGLLSVMGVVVVDHWLAISWSHDRDVGSAGAEAFRSGGGAGERRCHCDR